MYDNLKLEIQNNELRYYQIADALGCSVQTISHKLNGKSEFNLSECIKVKELLKSKQNVEQLFER